MRIKNLIILSVFVLLLIARVSLARLYYPNQDDDREFYREIDIHAEKDLPPIAYFDYSPSNPKVGDTVNLDANKSYDPDGNIIEYRWSYISKDVPHFPIFIGVGEKIRYSWNEPGYYIVTLTVRDNRDLESTYQREIRVEKILIPPVADFSFNPSDPKVGEEVTFDASSSYDPDGEVTRYIWDFGDGITGTGQRITHIYSSPGSYVVILTIIDNDDLDGKTEKSIDIKEEQDADGIPDSQDNDGNHIPDSVDDDHSEYQDESQDTNNNEGGTIQGTDPDGHQVDNGYVLEENESKKNESNSYKGDECGRSSDQTSELNYRQSLDKELQPNDSQDVTLENKGITERVDFSANLSGNYALYGIFILNVTSIIFFLLSGRRTLTIHAQRDERNRKNFDRVEILEIRSPRNPSK